MYVVGIFWGEGWERMGSCGGLRGGEEGRVCGGRRESSKWGWGVKWGMIFGRGGRRGREKFGGGERK